MIFIDQTSRKGRRVGDTVESVKTKASVVLLVTADANQVHAMQDWNGRQKITLVGADQGNFGYRWSEKEVDTWLDEYLNNSYNSPNYSRKDQFSCGKTEEEIFFGFLGPSSSHFNSGKSLLQKTPHQEAVQWINDGMTVLCFLVRCTDYLDELNYMDGSKRYPGIFIIYYNLNK